MKKVVSFLTEYFGFFRRQKPEAKYPYNLVINDDVLQERLDYLKASDQQETARLTTIESKMSQLVGQTGIILTLLGLFISTYLGKASSWPIGFKCMLIFLFLVCLFFYLSTIFHATKHFNIINYKYGRRDPSTVKGSFSSKQDFLLEEIKDLIYTIEQNTGLNDSKGDDLMYGYRTFQIGTLSGATLILILISSSFYSPKVDTPKMRIENEVKVHKLDSSLSEIQTELKQLGKRPIIIDTTLSK